MKVISVVNQKGGVGKTNLVTNLSAYLANSGKKILLIDFDPQANATSGLGIGKDKKGIYEILNNEISIEEGIFEVKKNLFLIPANQDLVGATIEWVNQPERESILKKTLASLNADQRRLDADSRRLDADQRRLNADQRRVDFDFVFIDTPPSLGLLTINSLIAADYLVIPVQAEYYALEGLNSLLNTVNLIKNTGGLGSDLDILGAVITMYDKRSRLSYEVWEELYKHFSFNIFRTIIPRNIKLAEAPSFGQSILDFGPLSAGARAYKRLAKEFIIKISKTS